ncbi:MAG: hypothetical protein WCO84_01150 [bacterium]
MKPTVFYVEKDGENVIFTRKGLEFLLEKFYDSGLQDGRDEFKPQITPNVIRQPLQTTPYTTPYKLPDDFKTVACGSVDSNLTVNF